MANECIFCRVASGDVRSDIVYQDESVVAFRDISPQAPVHVLIIPRAHIATLAQLPEDQQELLGRLLVTAKKLAAREGLAEKGYRLVINCGPEGGQQVPHVHLHLIGGRKLADELG
ncbi:MAG: histidine triad nucleotide-binding protein [Dehalococcoidia bacterium]